MLAIEGRRMLVRRMPLFGDDEILDGDELQSPLPGLIDRRLRPRRVQRAIANQRGVHEVHAHRSPFGAGDTAARQRISLVAAVGHPLSFVRPAGQAGFRNVEHSRCIPSSRPNELPGVGSVYSIG